VPIISFNYDFDGAFLQSALNRHPALGGIDNVYGCALRLAQEAWSNKPSHRLQDLALELNLQPTIKHRALDDALLALEIYLLAARRLNRWK
jgi:DNA polymerase III epsilon subunit-like protein